MYTVYSLSFSFLTKLKAYFSSEHGVKCLAESFEASAARQVMSVLTMLNEAEIVTPSG